MLTMMLCTSLFSSFLPVPEIAALVLPIVIAVTVAELHCEMERGNNESGRSYQVMWTPPRKGASGTRIIVLA